MVAITLQCEMRVNNKTVKIKLARNKNALNLG
jgi:hypothetical protein